MTRRYSSSKREQEFHCYKLVTCVAVFYWAICIMEFLFRWVNAILRPAMPRALHRVSWGQLITRQLVRQSYILFPVIINWIGCYLWWRKLLLKPWKISNNYVVVSIKSFLGLPISLRKHKNLKNIRVLKKNLNFFRKYNTVKI